MSQFLLFTSNDDTPNIPSKMFYVFFLCNKKLHKNYFLYVQFTVQK